MNLTKLLLNSFIYKSSDEGMYFSSMIVFFFSVMFRYFYLFFNAYWNG